MTEQTSREAARKRLLLNASTMNNMIHRSHGLWRQRDDLLYRHAERRNRHELRRPCAHPAFDNLFIADATLRDCLIGLDLLGEHHPGAAFRTFREGHSALDRDCGSAAANKKVPT